MAQQLSHRTRGKVRQDQFPLASGGSFLQDQMLIWNSGVLRMCATDANLGATGDTTRIVGTAANGSLAPWPGATGNIGVIGVNIAEPGTQFLLPLYSATPASAVADPANQIGRSFGLRNVGGNYDSVNLDDTTNKKAIIVGYYTEEYPTWPGKITSSTGVLTAGTTQYPWVWVEILANACALTGAANQT